MSSILLDNVSYCYRDSNQVFLALDGINLSIESGEFVCLVGHSGCGKSTLLSLLSGLAKPDIGTISIDGEEVSGPSVDRAMVFQHYSLFPWMTVAKNVDFSIRHSRRALSREQARAEVKRCLLDVGMLDAADKYPYQLSGGMQQRVAIARALAMDSDILLLDEPFGALDARNRTELQELLVRLWQSSERKRTVVFVTHDLNEALLLADRIVFMRPKHIERIVNVPFARPRSLEALSLEPEFREMRSELLELFYLDENAAGDCGSRRGAAGGSSGCDGGNCGSDGSHHCCGSHHRDGANAREGE